MFPAPAITDWFNSRLPIGARLLRIRSQARWGSASATQRVRSQPSSDLVHLSRRQQRAGIWPVQVKRVMLCHHPHADFASRFWWRRLMISESAIQAQVNVQYAVSLPEVEKVFTVGFHASQQTSTEQLSFARKTSLRRADQQALSGENALVVSGSPVDRVAFWHGLGVSLIDKNESFQRNWRPHKR